MQSPFKFLDAFNPEDKGQFFGREQETEELFHMVSKAPLALLYGLSGTGKTSLIQCGLASRFKESDWLPIFIRRQENINQSLLRALQKFSAPPLPEPLPEAIWQLYQDHRKPIYLLFDQLEELFIMGSWEEQKKLEDSFQAILDAKLPCTILLVMREEYIGRLYSFEKDMPYLADFRLRVEPMTSDRLKEVVLASFQKFNISLEPSAEEWVQQWAKPLGQAHTDLSLASLQVFLDRLYYTSYIRIYGTPKRVGEFPPVTITRQEAGNFGQAEQALEILLNEQELELQAVLSRRFPSLPRDTIREVLDIFVTEAGTSRPLRRQLLISSKLSDLPEEIQPHTANLTQASWTASIELLENSRLFRASDGWLELTHDSLATLIDAHRTDEQRQLNEIKRRIYNHFLDYQRSGEFLNRRQLDTYEEYLPLLILEPSARQFIQDSQEHAAWLEATEKNRQQRELEKVHRKVETQKRATQRQRAISAFVGLTAIIAITVGLWAWKERQNTLIAETQAKKEAFQSQLLAEAELKRDGQYQQAIQQLRTAASFAIGEENQQIITDSMLLYQRLAEVMAEADSLARETSTLSRALALYQEAIGLSADEWIRNKARQAEGDINRLFNDYLLRAENIIKYGDCSSAQDVLSKASQLKPEHPALKKLLDQCPLK